MIYKHRAKDCMKKFCESLREHAMEIINFKKKKMKLLTNKQLKSYENAKIYYICKEMFEDKHAKDKKYCKVRDHFHYTSEYRGAAHNICNLKYSVPKEITIVFHNGSNYDYHVITKKTVEELERQFTCLGENTEKFISFSVPIAKELIKKKKNHRTISYRLQFIDSARLMASSLSNVVNNLTERIHKIRCKYGHDNK